MSCEFEKLVWATLGGFFSLILTAIIKWVSDKYDRKRIKTSEFFSALSVYIDYMITITFYPKNHISTNYLQMLLHLEELKSQFVEKQSMLVAYNLNIFVVSKSLVTEVINIDGEFTELIFRDYYTDKELSVLNNRAFSLLKKAQEMLEKVK